MAVDYVTAHNLHCVCTRVLCKLLAASWSISINRASSKISGRGCGTTNTTALKLRITRRYTSIILFHPIPRTLYYSTFTHIGPQPPFTTIGMHHIDKPRSHQNNKPYCHHLVPPRARNIPHRVLFLDFYRDHYGQDQRSHHSDCSRAAKTTTRRQATHKQLRT